MKKILTVSLVAIMAVGAAHAQIASTDWTMEQLGATETTLQGKIDEKVATSTYEQDKTALQGAINAKVAQSDYDTKMTQIAQEMGDLDVAKNGTIAAQIASKVSQSEFDTVIGEYDTSKGTVESRLSQVATNTEFTGLTNKVTALETSLKDDGATGSRIVTLEDSLKDTGATGSRIVALETADTTMAAKIGDVAEGQNLATMIANEENARKTADGDLATLTTDVDTSLVAAINEVDAHADAAQTDATSALTKIGTVEQGKNLATMLSEETTAREDADTGLQNQIGTYDAEKQTWSGLTGEVKTLETNLETKFAKTSTVKGAVVTTTANGEVAPVVPEHSEDGVYVLTATKNGDSVTYYWENIARKTPASEPETPNGEES